VYMLLENGHLDGTVALLVQSFHDGDRLVMAVQAVDGLMGHSLRGRGLFTEVMTLVTTCSPDGVEGPRFGLGVASLPGSMKALSNAGWHRLADFRVRKALMSSRGLRSLPWGTLLAAVLGPFWWFVRALVCWPAGRLSVRRISRFTEGLNAFQPRDRIHGDRSSAFLNWRVIDNPRDDLRAFAIYDGDQMLGYAVCKVLPSVWEVLELRSRRRNPACAAALLRYLHRVEGAPAVDFWLCEGFLQEEYLPRGLFDRGCSGAIFVYGLDAAGLPSDPSRWACSYLDSDW
jgi:hypothetical protein